MKRMSAIVCLVMLIVMSFAQVGLAADLKVIETSPKNGETGLPLENFGVKVYFDQDVYNEKNEKINEAACKLVDNKGNEVPSIVLFNEDDKDVALVLADETKDVEIKKETEYKLEIDDTFVSADGEKLATPVDVSFETLNPNSTMIYSVGMMAVMVVGMLFFTAKEATKKSRATNAEAKAATTEKFNPYKIAKEEGLSLAEVMDREKKRKEREEKKLEKIRKKKEEEGDDYLEPGHYRVKKIRSAGEAGSVFVAEKKEEARQKAIEERIKHEEKKKNSKRKQKK